MVQVRSVRGKKLGAMIRRKNAGSAISRRFRTYYAELLDRLQGSVDGKVKFARFDILNLKSRIVYATGSNECVVLISPDDSDMNEIDGQGSGSVNVRINAKLNGKRSCKSLNARGKSPEAVFGMVVNAANGS